jgi:hypothetical protein
MPTSTVPDPDENRDPRSRRALDGGQRSHKAPVGDGRRDEPPPVARERAPRRWRTLGSIGTHTDPASSADPNGSSPPAAPVLVWHRVNGPQELERFLDSPIRWVECDLRLGEGGQLVVSHEPVDIGVRPMTFDDWLDAVIGAGRSAKLDLKEGGRVLDGALRALERRACVTTAYGGTPRWRSPEASRAGVCSEPSTPEPACRVRSTT